MKAFWRIRDKEDGTFWVSPKGKTIWTGSGPAKNAYNYHVGYWRKRFNLQDVYELVKFKLVEVKD